MDVLTSTNNPLVKRIKKLLLDRVYRYEEGAFWCDGVNFVSQAIDNGWEIDTLVFVPQKIDSDFKRAVWTKALGVKKVAVSESVYQALSSKKDIQGVGAIIKMKTGDTLERGLGVVLEHLQTPGNLGTIMRTCLAFDIKCLYLIAPSVDPFNPDTVRASMGALFGLKIVVIADFAGFASQIKKNLRYCIGTSLQEATLLSNYSRQLEGTELIWFGNEAKGLSIEARRLCQDSLKVPISPIVDSLNVAECAAIILYTLLHGSR